MTYKYFFGCVIPGRLPYLEASARKIFNKLGINVSDQTQYSCCPDPTGVAALDHKSWLALGARNLSLYENDNSDVLSLCSGCTETLKTVQHILNNDPEEKKEINSILNKIGKKYQGNINIKHFAQVLFENLNLIKENIIKPLKDLKVACHPGCHYLRPSEIIQWDDPFEPTTLDVIVEALGAEPVDYELKKDCCGNPLEKSDKELSQKLLLNKLESIKKSGADCIVCVCPACYQQFDFNQRELNKNLNTDFNFPVFYLTELIALALGIKGEEIGLKFHRVRVNNLLQKINILESPNK